MNGTSILPRRSETVLVVDDERDLLELAVEFLEEMGYRTLAASNGPEAVALLESGEKIDLLFSDIVMHDGMNGCNLAKKAIELRPGIKVLLTSALAGRIAMDPDTPARPEDILPKPYRLDEMAQRVRRVLDGMACAA